MSEERMAFSERDEIEMLLPWYVSGTLDATDRRRVEHYLAQHPEIRRQLDLIREERDETIAAHAVLPASSPGALERLLAAPPRRHAGVLARFGREAIEAIADFFAAPTPRAVRLVAAAAGVLLLLEAAAITAFIVRDDGGGYQTAAGRDAGGGVGFWVGFSDQASAAAISRLLAELDARIVDGPKPGGIYKVEVRSADTSPGAVEALGRRLAERQELVRVVLPAKE